MNKLNSIILLLVLYTVKANAHYQNENNNQQTVVNSSMFNKGYINNRVERLNNEKIYKNKESNINNKEENRDNVDKKSEKLINYQTKNKPSNKDNNKKEENTSNVETKSENSINYQIKKIVQDNIDKINKKNNQENKSNNNINEKSTSNENDIYNQGQLNQNQIDKDKMNSKIGVTINHNNKANPITEKNENIINDTKPNFLKGYTNKEILQPQQNIFNNNEENSPIYKNKQKQIQPNNNISKGQGSTESQPVSDNNYYKQYSKMFASTITSDLNINYHNNGMTKNKEIEGKGGRDTVTVPNKTISNVQSNNIINDNNNNNEGKYKERKNQMQPTKNIGIDNKNQKEQKNGNNVEDINKIENNTNNNENKIYKTKSDIIKNTSNNGDEEIYYLKDNKEQTIKGQGSILSSKAKPTNLVDINVDFKKSYNTNFDNKGKDDSNIKKQPIDTIFTINNKNNNIIRPTNSGVNDTFGTNNINKGERYHAKNNSNKDQTVKGQGSVLQGKPSNIVDIYSFNKSYNNNLNNKGKGDINMPNQPVATTSTINNTIQPSNSNVDILENKDKNKEEIYYSNNINNKSETVKGQGSVPKSKSTNPVDITDFNKSYNNNMNDKGKGDVNMPNQPIAATSTIDDNIPRTNVQNNAENTSTQKQQQKANLNFTKKY